MAFSSLIRLSLSIPLILLSLFVFDAICFTPLPRYGQTSAIINKNIYYMGGAVSQPEPIISDFFYLDTSALHSAGSLTTLPWSELSGFNLFVSGGTAVAGGANSSLFVLFGGLVNPDNSSLVIVYDTNNNTWNSPQISAPQGIPTRRKQTQAVVDSTGKMYIFGGSTALGSDIPSPVNNMDILDTINWSWTTGSQNGSVPGARIDFSATILDNGRIVYIGGSDINNRYVPMNQIFIYDTTSDVWINMVTTGNAPNPRGGHSAVLKPNGLIIIYGGAFSVSADGQYTAASPDLAVLDTTNNNSFAWSQPSASGTAPSQVAYHSASLIDHYMIVAFGNATSNGPSPNLYILDTKDDNYKWITSMDTNVVAATPGANSGGQKQNIGFIVGITIAGIVLLILLIGGLFWFYKRRKMNQVIETPGEFTDAGFTRRYDAMNSATTSQNSYDLRYLAPANTEPDPSKEFHPSYSHNFPVQHDPEIEDDDKEFRILPKELQPEYLEKYHNNVI